ncbi:hypothetical protein [Pseudolysinimonas kribbensis]|uniref:hypothetical protein n=1 Tax=Pseudolysinimonas kribbensis TaxID=433641 RepID=UPI0024E18F51|nr:hypothetical protein [Pseudolysinimonas kribbensis]
MRELASEIESGKLVVRAGDILVSKLNPRKSRVHIVPSDGDVPTISSSEFVVFRPRLVHGPYLAYAMSSAQSTQWFSANTRSVTRSHQRVEPSVVGDLEVPDLTLDVQRQIADYLDAQTAKIDALIGKQEQLIQTLAERRQAVISHAVTKGLDPNAPMKDSGVVWLGAVPRSWRLSSLKRLIRSQASGTSVNAMDVPAEGDEVGVLKTSSVSTGVFVPSENKTVIEADISRVTTPVESGSILVNRANSPERVGAAALVRESAPNLYLSDKIWQLSFERADAGWLYWWLQTATYRDQVSSLRVGTSSSMQNLSYEDFREIRIAVAPQAEQRRIAYYLDHETSKIDALSAKAREMIDVLKERRQALISAAVTGKIDVRGLA